MPAPDSPRSPARERRDTADTVTTSTPATVAATGAPGTTPPRSPARERRDAVSDYPRLFHITRRGALKALGLAAASALLPRSTLRAEAQAAAGIKPAEPLRLAFVGVGGQGHGHVELLAAEHPYVAFADVDDKQAAQAYAQFPTVPRYRDFRKMLDKHAASIDAVIIATPDHSHFPIAMACLEAGKHVYVEKPLAPTPWECRRLADTAISRGLKTQLGIQGHSASALRMLREWIDAGVAGPIETVYLWTDRMQPHRYHWAEAAAPAEPVPDTLSWDLWLAGRPKRAFSSEYVPNRWRNWWGLGTGPLGDIGAHMFDVVEFALNIGFPEWVEADVPAISAFTAPPWSRVRWHFPARGGRDAVQAFWYNGWKDGVQNHPEEVPRVPRDVMINLTNGIAFVGTEGTIVIEDMRASARPRLYPLERERDVLRNPPAKRLPRVEGGHFEDFFNAIRSDALAGADFRYGAALTEMVLLGTFAQRTGKRIRWNRELMRTEDTPEADAFVKPVLEPGGF